MGECKHWAQPACKRRITTESFCFLPLHPSTPTYTRPPPAPTRTSLPKHPRVAAPFPGRRGNGGRYESRSEPLVQNPSARSSMSKPSARKSVSTKPPEVQIGGASSALASHGDPVTSRAVSVAKQSSFEVEVGTKEGKGFTYSARAAHHTHTRASASRTLNLHHAMLLSHTHTGSARFRRRSLTRSLAHSLRSQTNPSLRSPLSLSLSLTPPAPPFRRAPHRLAPLCSQGGRRRGRRPRSGPRRRTRSYNMTCMGSTMTIGALSSAARSHPRAQGLCAGGGPICMARTRLKGP